MDPTMRMNNSRFTINNYNVVGSNNVIEGNNNIIKGHNNKVVGNDNQIEGHYFVVKGDNNDIIGHNVTIRGNNNTLKGHNGKLYGKNNKAEGNNNSINGVYTWGYTPGINIGQINCTNVITMDNARVNISTAGTITVNGKQVDSPKIDLNLSGKDTLADPVAETHGMACTICLTNVKCVIFDCCNVSSCCIGCTKKLCQQDDVKCPICQKKFTKATRFY